VDLVPDEAELEEEEEEEAALAAALLAVEVVGWHTDKTVFWRMAERLA